MIPFEKALYIETYIHKDIYKENGDCLYLTGNAGLYLQGIIIREIKDYDIYFDRPKFNISKIDNHCDYLFKESGLMAPDFRERSKYLETQNNINIFCLSVEDIIINKISGLSDIYKYMPNSKLKHREDIKLLFEKGYSSIEAVDQLLYKALELNNYGFKHENFRKKAAVFLEEFKFNKA